MTPQAAAAELASFAMAADSAGLETSASTRKLWPRATDSATEEVAAAWSMLRKTSCHGEWVHEGRDALAARMGGGQQAVPQNRRPLQSAAASRALEGAKAGFGLDDPPT